MTRTNLGKILVVLKDVKSEFELSSGKYFQYEVKGLKGISGLRHLLVIVRKELTEKIICVNLNLIGGALIKLKKGGK